MSSTYLSLTNELLRRLNEVELDATNFDGARNVQALAKDSINSSVREMLHSAQEWPFTLTTQLQTLTVGQASYSFPTDTSSVDWESFYLKKLSDSNEPGSLSAISYPQYIEQYRGQDEAAGTGGYGPPIVISMTQESKFIVSPPPDQAYIIEYKYWSFPASLTASSNTCIIPERFNNVIIDGAMMFMMLFRSNEQSASIHKEKFEQGIKTMRRLLMDEPLHVRSTMLTKPTLSTRVMNG
jgi:hypothetical protein